MRAILLRCFAVWLVFGSAAAVSATMLAFSDMEMKLQNWPVISKFATVSESSSVVGGKAAIQFSTGPQLWAAAYKNDISWNPATLGMILNITASGTFFYSNSPITPVDFLPILVQGANVYAPPGNPPYLWEPPIGGVAQDHQWDPLSLPVTIFGREVGSGPATPDFSPGASPIYFGFAGRRDSGGATYRFGNVTFSVTGIPEPDTLTLSATMLGSIFVSARSRRSKCKLAIQ